MVRLVSPWKPPSNCEVRFSPGGAAAPLGTSPTLTWLEYSATAGDETCAVGSSVVVFEPYSSRLPEDCTVAPAPIDTVPEYSGDSEVPVFVPATSAAGAALETRSSAPPVGSTKVLGICAPVPLAVIWAPASTMTLSWAARMMSGPVSAVALLPSSTV